MNNNKGQGKIEILHNVGIKMENTNLETGRKQEDSKFLCNGRVTAKHWPVGTFLIELNLYPGPNLFSGHKCLNEQRDLGTRGVQSEF